MPSGIPGPLTGEYAFDIDLVVGATHDLGLTPYGRSSRLEVLGGTIDGAAVRGTVATGGIEDVTELDNGVTEVEQIHLLKLGEYNVYMHNYGVAPAASSARMVLDFEAANAGPYAFLHEAKYVATRVYDPEPRLLRLKAYKVSEQIDLADALSVQRSVGGMGRPVDCAASTASRAELLYEAAVDLTGYWSVGESKHGTRNAIPIAGGAVTGKLTGRILPGGADYQLAMGETLSLDARYLLELADGELVAVRNCGPTGALVPTFETRTDGPFAWLNQGSYLSADPEPSVDLSGVKLSVYESR